MNNNNIITYKCPSCGADLTYSPEVSGFKCKFCGSFHSEQQVQNQNQAAQAQSANSPAVARQSNQPAELKDYICPSCGAAVIVDSAEIASTSCVYCNSPVILSDKLSGEFLPSKIIPFIKTKDIATAELSKFCKRKIFLQSAFKTSLLQDVRAVYVPFWIVSCEVDGMYKGTSSYTKNKSTHYVHHEREGKVKFTNIPADASEKIDDKLMDNLEPFYIDKSADFHTSYLSGFSAQRYDVTQEQIVPRIEERVFDATRKIFIEDIRNRRSASDLRLDEEDYNMYNASYDLMMFPVWLLNYKHDNKIYSFAMNGQTGKFSGNLPVSKLKLGLFYSVIFAIVASIGVLMILNGEVTQIHSTDIGIEHLIVAIFSAVFSFCVTRAVASLYKIGKISARDYATNVNITHRKK